MKHRTIALATMLALGASAPAAAQTTPFASPANASPVPTPVVKIDLKGPKPNTSPMVVGTVGARTAGLGMTPAPAVAPRGTDKAPFGCAARAPAVCNFHIFYPRGGRDVFLPAGMRATVPEVKIGRDGYCVALDKKPAHNCARKIINAKYNS